jgi:eukaryotic-like serine/threonine-protein kinase
VERRPGHWQKIKQIVGQALELSPSRRPSYLDNACGQDAGLRSEVDSLLSAHADAGDLSQSPWSEQGFDAALIGQSIGPYRLIKKLGEGGMGQVWLAEQISPVRRQVAIKLIRGGMFDPQMLQRFQAERQSLALMDHPAIAKVFDAGATSQGQPYFVMEYVEGLPINRYCDVKKLSIGERLRLFLQLCDGVQHAHQKAIIHRDIKPANILVVEIDGKPTARIIDFGLAKATVARDPGQTVFTQAGSFVGTPGYTSPEQADPSVEDIDTRADVYSLGVVLYELLTGGLPFDPKRLSKLPIDKILRIAREEDPPSPSTRVSSDRENLVAVAALRSTNSTGLPRLLRGDLDWITMKALERDRDRRYRSPSEFAADLERYVSNRPVLARRASAGYRVQKYIARHRVLTTTAAIVGVLIVGFIATLAYQLRRTTRERDRANRVTEFVTHMFEVADPGEARGNSITVREILDKASKDIVSDLSNDPQLQAQLMSVMGDVYHQLGLYPKANELLTHALQIENRILGPDNPETASTTSRLAASLADAGNLTEAEKLLRPLVEIEKRNLGPENRKTLVCMNLLATTLHGQAKYTDAEKMYRQILETQRRVYGPDDPITLTLESNIAAVLSDSGSHSPEIEKLDREVLESRRRVLGPDHPDTLRSMANLGIALTAQGNRATEAERLLQETLETQRRVLGPEHPDTLGTMGALTAVYELEYRYVDEEKLARQTLEIERRVLGPEHGDTLAAMANLAGAIGLQKRYAEAEQIARQTLEIENRVLAPEHPTTLVTKANLADILDSEHRLPEADKLVNEVLEADRHVFGAENPTTVQAMYIQGRILKDEGHLDDAQKMLLLTRETAKRVLPTDDPRIALCNHALACVAARQGKRADAIALLQEALDHGLDPPTAGTINTEPDFKTLRGDPQFETLVALGKRPTGVATK